MLRYYISVMIRYVMNYKLFLEEGFMAKTQSQISFTKRASDAGQKNFVYLLLERSEEKFKIGHTRNPFNRISSLGGRSRFNDDSIIFSVGASRWACIVESHLQKTFAQHRLPFGEWFTPGDSQDRRRTINAAEAYVIQNSKAFPMGHLGMQSLQAGGCWTLQDFYAFRSMTPFEAFD